MAVLEKTAARIRCRFLAGDGDVVKIEGLDQGRDAVAVKVEGVDS